MFHPAAAKKCTCIYRSLVFGQIELEIDALGTSGVQVSYVRVIRHSKHLAHGEFLKHEAQFTRTCK